MPQAKDRAFVRMDPAQKGQLEKLAERLGTTTSELLRAGAETTLEQAGATAEKPSSPWTWCLKDFEVFAEGLELPDGAKFRLEGHIRLILREVFATGRVELLILLPKGNYKTALFAALAVFHLVTVKAANCFIGAADKIQADEMYRFTAHFSETDSRIERLVLVRRSTREIRSEIDQGFIRVLASDDSKQGGKRQGFNPTLALIDELHAHENPNLYLDMRSGLFKRNGLLVTVTTAGHDQEGVLGKLRNTFLEFDQDGGEVRRGLKETKAGSVRQAKAGRLTIARAKSGRTVMLEWACTPDDDLSNPKVVKLANPASGVSIASIVDAQEAGGISPWAFARYRANVWTLGFESWLPHRCWEQLGIGDFDPAPYIETDRRRTCLLAPPRLGVQDGDDVFCAVDMGRYRDTAAVVCVAPRGNEPPAVWLAFVERSGGIDAPIAYGPVKDALRELDQGYRLLAAGFDPKYFDQSATELEEEGLPMVKFDQSNERMGPATANLRQSILEGGMRHDGDPILRAHVEAGVTKDVGPDQFRLVKAKRSGPPIDGVISLTMAWSLAFFRPAQPDPFVWTFA